MKRLDWMLVIILAGVVIVLSLLHNPAYASSSCRTQSCDDRNDRTIFSFVKDDDNAKRTLNGLALTALIACGGTSVYQGVANKDWRFCWNYFEWKDKKPAKYDGKMTPDNLSDKPIGVRLYQ